MIAINCGAQYEVEMSHIGRKRLWDI